MMPSNANEEYFKIDGKNMPIPSTINLLSEIIWSKNSGRTSDTTFTGDIVGYKKKLQLSWGILTREELKILQRALKPAFFTVYFLNDETNGFETITCYRGELSASVYCYCFDHTYKDISVNLIEK